MTERNCHKCHFLQHDYDVAKMHEQTFLYRCFENTGLTTNELKKNCRMKGNLRDNYDDGRQRVKTYKIVEV